VFFKTLAFAKSFDIPVTVEFNIQKKQDLYAGKFNNLTNKATSTYLQVYKILRRYDTLQSGLKSHPLTYENVDLDSNVHVSSIFISVQKDFEIRV
jgi:hypothetical protein